MEDKVNKLCQSMDVHRFRVPRTRAEQTVSGRQKEKNNGTRDDEKKEAKVPCNRAEEPLNGSCKRAQ